MCLCVCGGGGVYLGLNFFFGGGGKPEYYMTAAQDIHIDLMHVLYVYRRVMRGGGGGGGVLTKYSKGRGGGSYKV